MKASIVFDDAEIEEIWDCIAAYRDVTIANVNVDEDDFRLSPAFETGFQKLNAARGEVHSEI